MKKYILTIVLSFFISIINSAQDYWAPGDSPGNGNIQQFASNSQNHIFGGSFDGIFRSTDNGDSWVQLSPMTLGSNPNILDIVVNSNDEVYISASTSGGTPQGFIYKSTDNGDTWQDITGTVVGTIARTIATNALDHVFLGTSIGVYKSTDGGTAWNLLTNFPLNTFVKDIVVDDDGIVIAGTTNGVLQSTNGGDNWEAINTDLTTLFVEELALGPSNGKQNLTELFAATIGGGVFKFDRITKAWIAYIVGLPTLYAYSLAFNSAGDLFVGTDKGLFVYLVGASAWTLVNVPTLTTLFIAAILITTLDHMFLAEDWGGVHRSTDGGVTWLRKNLLLTAYAIHLLFYSSAIQTLFLGSNMGFWFREAGSAWAEMATPFAFFWVTAMAATTTYLFVATFFDGIWRLTRSTGIWTEINNGITSGFITALVITAIGHLFVGTSGAGVFRSINNGDLWVAFNVGLASLFITALVLHPLGYIFAATSNLGIFRMDLVALTWAVINSGLTTLLIRHIVVNSFGALFAATNGGGVFRSSDMGNSWGEANTGLSKSEIDVLGFRRIPASETTSDLYAVGGGTLFKSTDNGDSWAEETTGIPGNRVTSIGADSSGGVYAGTSGGGIYQNGVVTSVHQINNDIPTDYLLGQNYPNPFNPSTTFNFSISKSGFTELKIYNTLGEVVETLVNKELPAGNYNFDWNATDMPSGVYFYWLNSGKYNQTKKALLLK